MRSIDFGYFTLHVRSNFNFGREMMTRNRMFLMMMAGMACVLLASCSDKKTDGKADKKTDRWIHYGTSTDGSERHYDKQSIATVSPKVVKVWDRVKLSMDAKNKVIEQRKRSQLPTDGWDKLDNVRLLREVDCANHTYKRIRIEDYSENGKIMYEADYPNPNVETIPPGTTIESLLKAVCPQ
jgi:hypothetical protein